MYMYRIYVSGMIWREHKFFSLAYRLLPETNRGRGGRGGGDEVFKYGDGKGKSAARRFGGWGVCVEDWRWPRRLVRTFLRSTSCQSAIMLLP